MSEEHNGDCVWFNDEEDPVPPKACLLHGERPCTETYHKPGNNNFGGILYGLCDDCVALLGQDPRYIDLIDEEIELRLNKIKSERMH